MDSRIANVHDGQGNGFLRVGLPDADLGTAKLGRRGSVRAELAQSSESVLVEESGLRLAH